MIVQSQKGFNDYPKKEKYPTTYPYRYRMRKKHLNFSLLKCKSLGIPFWKVVKNTIVGDYHFDNSVALDSVLTHSIESYLYDYHHDDMPYGTQKARDGDPSEWIANEHEWYEDKDYQETYGNDWPELN